ncbi:unnamed protein product [Clavelina lepadiformis]|uniref:DZF domain-containing protein n=1 Tax=Clavelina lepadiformis TaxID=159417 RepID=A0ABP0GAX8_CLALP
MASYARHDGYSRGRRKKSYAQRNARSNYGSRQSLHGGFEQPLHGSFNRTGGYGEIESTSYMTDVYTPHHYRNDFDNFWDSGRGYANNSGKTWDQSGLNNLGPGTEDYYEHYTSDFPESSYRTSYEADQQWHGEDQFNEYAAENDWSPDLEWKQVEHRQGQKRAHFQSDYHDDCLDDPHGVNFYEDHNFHSYKNHRHDNVSASSLNFSGHNVDAKRIKMLPKVAKKLDNINRRNKSLPRKLPKNFNRFEEAIYNKHKVANVSKEKRTQINVVVSAMLNAIKESAVQLSREYEEQVNLNPSEKNDEPVIKSDEEATTSIDNKKTKPCKKKPVAVLIGALKCGDVAMRLLVGDCMRSTIVVLAKQKPTRNLLVTLREIFPFHLAKEKEMQNQNFTLSLDDEAECIVTKFEDFDGFEAIIRLTSPEWSDQGPIGENKKIAESDLLSSKSCLIGLAAIRRLRFFSTKLDTSMQGLTVTRVILHMRETDANWKKLSVWLVVVLVCTAMDSAEEQKKIMKVDEHESENFTKVDFIFKRCMEILSSGVLLPDSIGLKDPCEKETDVGMQLDVEAAEDITAAAQNSLRLMEFGKLHSVLGLENESVKYG